MEALNMMDNLQTKKIAFCQTNPYIFHEYSYVLFYVMPVCFYRYFISQLPKLLEASQIPHIAWDSGWHTEWILWMCLQTTGTKDSWPSTSWCRPVERNAEHKQSVRVHWITCGIFRVQRVYWCKLQWQHPLSLLCKGKYPITLQETNTCSAFIL